MGYLAITIIWDVLLSPWALPLGIFLQMFKSIQNLYCGAIKANQNPFISSCVIYYFNKFWTSNWVILWTTVLIISLVTRYCGVFCFVLSPYRFKLSLDIFDARGSVYPVNIYKFPPLESLRSASSGIEPPQSQCLQGLRKLDLGKVLTNPLHCSTVFYYNSMDSVLCYDRSIRVVQWMSGTMDQNSAVGWAGLSS